MTRAQKQGLSSQKGTVTSQPSSLVGSSQTCFQFRVQHGYACFPVESSRLSFVLVLVCIRDKTGPIPRPPKLSRHRGKWLQLAIRQTVSVCSTTVPTQTPEGARLRQQTSRVSCLLSWRIPKCFFEFFLYKTTICCGMQPPWVAGKRGAWKQFEKKTVLGWLTSKEKSRWVTCLTHSTFHITMIYVS